MIRGALKINDLSWVSPSLTGKAVTGKTLSGTDAGNYNLVQQTGLSANITSAGRP